MLYQKAMIQENLITKLVRTLNRTKLQNQLRSCTNQLEDLPQQDLVQKAPDTRKIANREDPSKASTATCFLGVLEKTNNGENVLYYGSSFAISRKVIITSASFVVNKNGIAQSIAIIPSPKGLYDNVEVYSVQNAYPLPKFYYSDHPNNDFAVLVLEEELPEEVGQYALSPKAIHRLNSNTYNCHNHSYPVTSKFFEMAYDQYSVQKGANYLIAKNHSSEGQSGSPVSIICDHCEYPVAIGVHCATIEKPNNKPVATVITSIDEEKISFLHEVLPGELIKQIIIH